MHLAYFVARYPEPSETFLMRELDELTNQGFRVTVCALRNAATTSESNRRPASPIPAFYRPSLFSAHAFSLILSGLIFKPLRLILLAQYACSLASRNPKYAFALLANLHTVAFFSQLLHRHNVDHIHGYFLNLPAVLAVAVSNNIGIPCSLAGHARDVFVEPCPLDICAEYACNIVLCHDCAAHHIATIIPAHLHYKLKIIRHGIDPRMRPFESDQAMNAKTTPPTILAVGRLVEKKGFDVLVISCGILRDRNIPFHLLIVGSGPENNALKQLVKELQLTDHVTFAGWQEESTLRRLMALATVLVAPSVIAHDGDRDGIPNVLLEAGAAGLPVIAGKLDGMAEFITDGVTGIMTTPGDARALVDAIINALSDQDTRLRLASNARSLVEDEYDIQRNVHSLGQLFKEAGHDRAAL